MGRVLRPDAGGYSASVAFRLAGLTYRVGDYIARTGLVKPSASPAGGKGTARRYDFRDIVALRVVRELREAGLSLQRVRRCAKVLRRDWPGQGGLAGARLLTDGREAYLALAGTDLVALIDRPGQGAWRAMVNVGGLAAEVQASIEREEHAA